MLDTIIGAAVELAHADRQINLEQPSRGAYSSPVRASARVPQPWQAFARCVLKRESGASLDNWDSREHARNTSSSAAGRWQYLQAWQHGGSFMVRDRLVQFGMPRDQAKRVRAYLSQQPIHRWPGELQDVLFNEVIERGGWRHWFSGGSPCNAMVP